MASLQGSQQQNFRKNTVHNSAASILKNIHTADDEDMYLYGYSIIYQDAILPKTKNICNQTNHEDSKSIFNDVANVSHLRLVEKKINKGLEREMSETTESEVIKKSKVVTNNASNKLRRLRKKSLQMLLSKQLDLINNSIKRSPSKPRSAPKKSQRTSYHHRSRSPVYVCRETRHSKDASKQSSHRRRYPSLSCHSRRNYENGSHKPKNIHGQYSKSIVRNSHNRSLDCIRFKNRSSIGLENRQK